MTCELSRCDTQGNYRECRAPAVVIWRSRNGDILVCEQCEAIVQEVFDGGATMLELQRK